MEKASEDKLEELKKQSEDQEARHIHERRQAD
jgi:hypothetical protein